MTSIVAWAAARFLERSTWFVALPVGVQSVILGAFYVDWTDTNAIGLWAGSAVAALLALIVPDRGGKPSADVVAEKPAGR